MWNWRNKIGKECRLAGLKRKLSALQLCLRGEIQSVNVSFATSKPAVKSGLIVLIFFGII
jgi:hypothetical protein